MQKERQVDGKTKKRKPKEDRHDNHAENHRKSGKCRKKYISILKLGDCDCVIVGRIDSCLSPLPALLFRAGLEKIREHRHVRDTIRSHHVLDDR